MDRAANDEHRGLSYAVLSRNAPDREADDKGGR